MRDRFHCSRSNWRWIALLACLLVVGLTLPACGSVPSLPAVADPGGAWSGTITVRRMGESTETSGAGTCCSETTQRTLSDVVMVEMVNNLATGRVSYNYTEHVTSRQAYDPGTFDITMDSVTAGSTVDSKNSRVSVSLAKDGSYEIEVEVPPVDGTWARDGRSVLTCNYPPPTCSPTDSQTHDSAPAPGLSGASEVVSGQMTPGGPKVLSGTTTQEFLFDGVHQGTLTISWNLVRK